MIEFMGHAFFWGLGMMAAIVLVLLACWLLYLAGKWAHDLRYWHWPSHKARKKLEHEYYAQEFAAAMAATKHAAEGN